VALEWVSCLPTALGFQLWEAEISVCRRFLAALTLANCLIYALSITVTEQNCSLGGGKRTLWVVAVQNATTRDDDKNKRYSKLHSGARSRAGGDSCAHVVSAICRLDFWSHFGTFVSAP
jgi:UDP-3-O-acyl-N-acetylglucosamine deacetylase